MHYKQWLLIIVSDDCPLCSHIIRLAPLLSKEFKLNIEVKSFRDLTLQEINMLIQNDVLNDENIFNVPLFIFYNYGLMVDKAVNLPELNDKTPKTAFKELVQEWLDEKHQKPILSL